jgi:type I restriction enzyme S subunit
MLTVPWNLMSTQTALPSIVGSDVGNLYTVIPKLETQQRIANFLEHKTSEFDSIISKKEILIEKLEKAKKSLISEVVTGKVKIIDGELVKREAFEMKESGIEWLGMIPKDWEVKKLKYYTTKTGSGKTPRGGSEVYLEEGIPFLRSQNIYDDGLRLDDVVFISDRINREMINSIVIKGDILLNITGASIGRCCLYNLEKNANVNQHVCIVRLQDKSTYAKLMELLLQSNVVQDYINSCQTGSSREGLNFEQIKNIVIPISKDKNDIRDMATKIDNKVIAINSIITKTKLQIKKLKQAKQSLISECVTGKIDLRDWEIREI